MKDELLRVPVDAETLARLRERALIERRATSDEASILLKRALRVRRRPETPIEPAADR